MFKTWNVIDCGLRGESTGHHYWETKAITNELVRRGVTARIFCHKGKSAPSFVGAQVFPVFPLSLFDSLSQDAIWGDIENFVLHNKFFHRALAGIDRATFSSSLVLMPNMTERQMLGAIRWLAGFDARERPKTIMLLEPALGWPNKNFILSLYRKIWAQCPADIKREITLGVREPIVAEQYAAALGFAPLVLPHAFDLPEGENSIPPSAVNAHSKPITISFVGGARRERGAGLLPEVVEKCSSMNVQFVIQVKPGADPGFDGRILAELHGRANVQLHQGTMPVEDYYNVIANSVVLLPYDANRYQCRAAGVYVEAKCLGAPVIVSPGNWVAEEVRSFGNGIVCEERSVDAIVDAIMSAEQQIDVLRARAAASAVEFRAQHGVARFVDSVLGLVGGEGA